MDLTDLQKIGLTTGELKLYQALLEHGELTRTKLAKLSGISPSKIYDVANRLLEKGIISSVKKNNVLHFSPANPDKLNDFLEQKEKELQAEKNIVAQIMPLVMDQYKRNEETTDVEVFHGWEGLKTVYNDIANTLQNGDQNYVFGASQGENSKQADIFFSQYYQKVKKQGYIVNIIFNEEIRKNKQRIGIYSDEPHQVRFLHSNTFAEVNVYNNVVLFVLLLKNPIVMRLKNKDAADSYRTFFASLWKMAKP